MLRKTIALINEYVKRLCNITSPYTHYDINKVIRALHLFEAKDIMRNKIDICSISIKCISIETIASEISADKDCVIVFNENIDDILGILNLADILKIISHLSENKFNKKQSVNINKIDLASHIEEYLIGPIFAPRSMTIFDLLRKMHDYKIDLIVINDEYDGTDGIVTLRDIMNYILINLDSDDQSESSSNDTLYLGRNIFDVDAKTKLSEIESMMKVTIKKDSDNQTIGNLLLKEFGYNPKKGEYIRITPKLIAEIKRTTYRIIKTITLYKIEN